MKAKARHAELVRELRAHDYRYYVLDDPLIGDREYDALYAELTRLEAEHPELASADSPTRRVGGAPRTDLKTVEHVVPMMSLDNTYDQNELEEFVRRVHDGLPHGATPAFCVEFADVPLPPPVVPEAPESDDDVPTLASIDISPGIAIKRNVRDM